MHREVELIRPTRKQLEGVGKLYVASLVEDAAASTGALAHLGIEVRLVSGGYKEALVTTAEETGEEVVFEGEEVEARVLRVGPPPGTIGQPGYMRLK